MCASRSDRAAPMSARARAAPSAATDMAGAPTDGVRVRARSDFVGTPLFKFALSVPASGEILVPWTLPANTGAFEIRVYAVGRGGDTFGGGTATQLVRKPLTLTASVPRLARVGDALRCAHLCCCCGATSKLE